VSHFGVAKVTLLLTAMLPANDETLLDALKITVSRVVYYGSLKMPSIDA